MFLKPTTQISNIDESFVSEEDEKKIIESLRNTKYKWRTRKKIIYETKLDEETVNLGLSGLIQRNIVRATKGKIVERIFGL